MERGGRQPRTRPLFPHFWEWAGTNKGLEYLIRRCISLSYYFLRCWVTKRLEDVAVSYLLLSSHPSAHHPQIFSNIPLSAHVDICGHSKQRANTIYSWPLWRWWYLVWSWLLSDFAFISASVRFLLPLSFGVCPCRSWLAFALLDVGLRFCFCFG